MQDPNADTEWNDALRRQNILPPKEKQEAEVTEDEILMMVEETVQQKTGIDGINKELNDMTLDELDECEDEEDERVLQAYRLKRMMEMKEAKTKAKYGDVREISGDDYVREVNSAGEGVWVVLHLFQQGYRRLNDYASAFFTVAFVSARSVPLCALINQHLALLAPKFPQTKFLKSIASLCIRNYPDMHLPTIFVYFEGEMKKRFVGPHDFGGTNLTADALEWMLSKTGAVKTDLEPPPKKVVRDVLFSSLGTSNRTEDSEGSADENDWQ